MPLRFLGVERSSTMNIKKRKLILPLTFLFLTALAKELVLKIVRLDFGSHPLAVAFAFLLLAGSTLIYFVFWIFFVFSLPILSID